MSVTWPWNFPVRGPTNWLAGSQNSGLAYNPWMHAYRPPSGRYHPRLGFELSDAPGPGYTGPPQGDTGGNDGSQPPGGGGGGGGTGGGPPMPGYWQPGGFTYQGSQWGWIPNTPNFPLTGGPWGFWGPVPMPVAGPSELQTWAATNLPALLNTPLGVTLGQQFALSALNRLNRSFGESAAGSISPDNPLLQAARQAFEKTTLPQLMDMASRMGLGRSSFAQNAVAKAWGQMMVPLMRDLMGREMQWAQLQTQGSLAGARTLADLAAREAARQLGVLGTGMQFGAIGRNIAQEWNRSLYEDFLRRQRMWWGLYQPLLGSLPQTFGREVGREPAGLFKK